MSRRQTDEERIVNFFHQAEYAKVTTLYNVVRGVMRARTEEEEGGTGRQPSPRPARSKRAKRAKVKSASVSGEASDRPITAASA